MFDYENFFSVDNQTIFPNPFESSLNPFELNFKDDKDDYYAPPEAPFLNKEEEFGEALKPMHNDEEDQNIMPRINDCKFQVDEMGEEYKLLEMVLDEENSNIIEEGNEEIQKLNVIEGGQSSKKKEIIFEITKAKKSKRGVPQYARIDDCKIFCRAKINKWYIPSLNKAIKESDLPKELKKIIHSPCYKKFTQVVTCQTNYNDLQKTMATILCIGKETNDKQRQNYENIQAIFSNYQRNPTGSVEKIILLLNMPYEKAIERFYESDEFKEFKKDERALFYDKEVVRQKKISIFEDKGLIRLFKSYFHEEGKDKKMIGKKRRN